MILPLLVFIIGSLRKQSNRRWPVATDELPTISILVTCYSEGQAIEEKAKNLRRLDYPQEKLQIIFAADGPDEDPQIYLNQYLQDDNWQLFHFQKNRGKIAVINESIPQCTGEIIVFTDVDALLDTLSLKHLARQFIDPTVGGACGLHVLQTASRSEKYYKTTEQHTYWSFDTVVKKAENRLGCISSCYGTIYAIRRSLFTSVPCSVTDDAFQAMGIILQGYRFIFVPEAQAFIHPPSKNPLHEIKRRRRIVLRSLRGLWLSRKLFNPAQFGFYSVRLFVFKVLRRLTPMFLIVMWFTNLSLLGSHVLWKYLFVAQSIFYLMAFLGYKDWQASVLRWKPIKQSCALSLYFCFGNIGTLLGLIDFVRGKKVDRWRS